MYDKHPFGKFSYNRQKFAQGLVRFLNLCNKSGEIFDMGCGEGYWFELYMSMGYGKDRIVGVDISKTAIDQLKSEGFHVQVGDVLNLEFDDNIANATVCSGVIVCTTDPFKAFSEIVRITKPGGYMYLSVYNFWNPYFWIVHKATWPIRYFYWNVNKKILNCVYPIAKSIFQPIAYFAFGKFLDEETGKTLFMDQVMTPKAELFTKRKIQGYADLCNIKILEMKYHKRFMMIYAIMKK